MRERLNDYRERIWDGIERAFSEDNTPREIAASFAFGTFVAVLPTGGTALVLFVIIAYLFDRVSKIGIFAALIVYNPLVKWSIYGASYWVGSLLLGPVPGVSLADRSAIEFSFTAAPDIALRQLLGNVLFATFLAVLGYVVVLQLLYVYRRREVEPVKQSG